MKRILYIHHGGALGGAPLSLLYLLQQLDRSRYEPVVLCLADGPAVDCFRAERIETYVTPDISDFSHTELVWYGHSLLWQLPGKVLRFLPSVTATRRHLRRLQPDLVHINSSTLAAAARAARQEGVPIVWHVREPLARGHLALRRRWLRQQIHRYADRIIAISEHDRGRLIPSGKVRVIYNFVDFNTFDRHIPAKPARRKLNLSAAEHIVTMLGGCSEPKGTLPFVQAVLLVQREVRHVRFLVVGPKPQVGASDPGRAWTKRLLRADRYDRVVMAAASKAIAKGHIRFTGVRLDVPEVVAASNLLVFPSVVPHFGRPIIEAGAMSKPVVASDLGGGEGIGGGRRDRLVGSPWEC